MSGYNVLHPMGWDTFGLPAEETAIENKEHPDKTIERNIKKFKGQLKSMGLGYDWDREVVTSDKDYYKHLTQRLSLFIINLVIIFRLLYTMPNKKWIKRRTWVFECKKANF